MESRHSLMRPSVVAGRFLYILEHAKNRRVLHVGCVDAGLLHDRLARSALLHPRLAAVASHIVGIDVDVQGLEVLRGLGMGDLAVVNVCQAGWISSLPSDEFDIVIASEVLEHLTCPAVFLDGVRELAERREVELLITVPNAFSARRLRGLLRNCEIVHPDHVAYYSPVTLARLLTGCGFEIREMHPYSFQVPGVDRSPAQQASGSVGWRARSSRLFRKARRVPALAGMGLLFRISPWWAEGIVAVAVPLR